MRTLSKNDVEGLIAFRNTDVGRLIYAIMQDKVNAAVRSIPAVGYTVEKAAAQGNAARGVSELIEVLFENEPVEYLTTPPETYGEPDAPSETETLILPPVAGEPAAKPDPEAPKATGGVSPRLQAIADRVLGKRPAGIPENKPAVDTKPPEEKPVSKEDNIVAMRKKLEADTLEYQAKLKMTGEQVEEQRKRAAELETRLAKYDIRETLLFQEKFGAPQQQAQASILDALQKVAVSPEDWQAAMAEGPAKMNEMLAAMTEKGKSEAAEQLMISTHALGAIGRNANKFIQDHQAKLDEVKQEDLKLQAQRKEQMAAHRAAELNKVYDDVRSKEAWGVFLAPIDGQEAWNQQVARLSGAAKAIIDSNDFHLQAKAAHAAVLVPGLLSQIEQYRSEIHALKSKLGSVAGAASAGGGTGGGYVPKSNVNAAPKSWAESTKEAAKEAVSMLRKR